MKKDCGCIAFAIKVAIGCTNVLFLNGLYDTVSLESYGELPMFMRWSLIQGMMQNYVPTVMYAISV